MNEPQRLPRPLRRSKLNVPVRFTAEMIERIKPVAERQNMTVSSWIRRQIETALVADGQNLTVCQCGHQVTATAVAAALKLARVTA